MWVQYKHRFAYGEDKKWSYHEIPDDWETWGYDNKDESEEDRLGDFLKNETEILSQYDYSDKYRGIEFETVDSIPVDEIMKRLKRCESNAEYYANEVIRFREMLDKEGHITKEDTDI